NVPRQIRQRDQFPRLSDDARQRCGSVRSRRRWQRRWKRAMSADATLVSRAALVAEARAWIGTPYRHQASAKGAGCDCLGLVRGVWRALYGCEPEMAPPYTPDWAEAHGEETLLDAARRHLAQIEVAAAGPGDVLLFRMRADAPMKHAAILVDSAHI